MALGAILYTHGCIHVYNFHIPPPQPRAQAYGRATGSGLAVWLSEAESLTRRDFGKYYWEGPQQGKYLSPASSTHHSPKQGQAPCTMHPPMHPAPRTAHRAACGMRPSPRTPVYAGYIVAGYLHIQGVPSPNIQTLYTYTSYTYF